MQVRHNVTHLITTEGGEVILILLRDLTIVSRAKILDLTYPYGHGSLRLTWLKCPSLTSPLDFDIA